MYKIRILFGCLLALLLPLCTPCLAADFPDHSAKRLKEMLEQGASVFLLCPLSPLVFNEKNIPGSVNIPLKEIRKTKALPEDKNALIITYCLGPK